MYETKWRLDCLLKKFYNTQTYLNYQYDGESFDSIRNKVMQVNEETANKAYDNLSKHDFKKYVKLLPSICHSCEYWYRWDINFGENYKTDIVAPFLEYCHEQADILLLHIENDTLHECPEMDWHYFTKTLWAGVNCEMYSEAISLAEKLDSFFMATIEVKKVHKVPFYSMDYDLNLYDVNWTRHRLSLLLVLAKAYSVSGNKTKAIETYEEVVGLESGKYKEYGIKRLFYHLGSNRILEGIVELYILDPTPENRQQIFKHFQKVNTMPTESTYEAVMETMLVNYFIYEEVFGETVR